LLLGPTGFGQLLEPLIAPVALIRDIFPASYCLTFCALLVNTLIHPIKALLCEYFDSDAAIQVDVKVSVAFVAPDLLEAFNALLNHGLD
jgi:hypothetical protein